MPTQGKNNIQVHVKIKKGTFFAHRLLGCIKLNIRIGNRVNYEKFYITTEKCNNILGLPGIKDFDVVINIKKEICQVPPNKGQVNAITENKVPNFIRLTPAK